MPLGRLLNKVISVMVAEFAGLTVLLSLHISNRICSTGRIHGVLVDKSFFMTPGNYRGKNKKYFMDGAEIYREMMKFLVRQRQCRIRS